MSIKQTYYFEIDIYFDYCSQRNEPSKKYIKNRVEFNITETFVKGKSESSKLIYITIAIFF